MWKNLGADTGGTSYSIVDKSVPVKDLESFYHLAQSVIHNFTRKDCGRLVLCIAERC